MPDVTADTDIEIVWTTLESEEIATATEQDGDPVVFVNAEHEKSERIASREGENQRELMNQFVREAIVYAAAEAEPGVISGDDAREVVGTVALGDSRLTPTN